MTMSVSDLIFVHSGGAGNTTPANDLGGVISAAGSKRIKSQSCTSLTTITGVTINDAYGNAEREGNVSYQAATHFLSWKPYGGTAYYGTTVAPGTNTYLIGGSDGYLVVTVVYASLPSSDKIDTITVSNLQQNLFDDVSAARALSGYTQYRCVYILNSNVTDTAVDLRVWLNNDTPAGDSFTIGLGSSAKGGTEQLMGNEITAPNAVAFTAPDTYNLGLQIGDLSPASWKALWLKRYIPPMTRGTVISNMAAIALACTI